MKVIISPSKTQDFTRNLDVGMTQPIFLKKSDGLVSIIKEISKDDLSNIMKIKGNLLNMTYDNYATYDKLEENHAIASYIGNVFKEIDIENYDKDKLKFMKDNLIILSALYGVLRPYDIIKPYRLDMKMKFEDVNLYNYWKREVNEYLKKEDLIINLASNEFSKLIQLPMINISFKENKSGKFKTIGTYSKKARGLMVNFIMNNKITTIEEIKRFNLENYKLNKDLSDDKNLVFTR